jgi:hypothetical protein
MDSLNLSWRGQPHSGKRTALHAALKQLADLRGIPFSIQTKLFQTGGAKQDTGQISTTVDDDGGDEGGSEKDCFPYEYSLVHVGFDISRMSMQDKIYLKPILQRWGTGSQVLAGNQGRGSRILVFYHAHLFSTESYFLLHGLLENHFGDVSVWFTSELPVADRLADYFIEIPVARRFPAPTGPSWPAIFESVLRNWSSKSRPVLSETTEIRSFLYELLMRNLRWTDCLHYLLDVTLTLPLDPKKKKDLLALYARQEATAAGQTIPSYRIPLLWEALFLEIRQVVSQEDVDGGTSSGSETTRSNSKKPTEGAPTKVGSRQTKSRGSAAVPKGGSAELRV